MGQFWDTGEKKPSLEDYYRNQFAYFKIEKRAKRVCQLTQFLQSLDNFYLIKIRKDEKTINQYL